ncbi:MFS transporter [Oceanobacillus chungangensis]|uniref:MFS transporter n=1 Tax=Oceanobacillus chungangensis TaxID=1229152 RepID=A0A3D8PU94_9BACI|nr:MFS transporter [Oceanobacillus chungangensis]RDW19686.1 MFS transporter [Oceanobacillus chungangensis]
MREATADKLHIFVMMFLISLIMSIQAPIFTPYAAMIGASSILIGIMLSAAQLANLIGNLIAGPLVDRFGKRLFITLPLLVSGSLFIFHGLVANTAELLVLRALNGFSLAFLIPAAMALLSGYAENSRQQGKNMAVNGMLGTIASIIAPLIGGKLGVMVGYANSYFVIGAALIITSVYTMVFLKDRQAVTVNRKNQSLGLIHVLANPGLHVVFLVGFAVMYIHGVIIYEVPYLSVERGLSTVTTGKLFSFMAIGTFFSLSLFFINRFAPVKRMMFGLFGMCMTLFALINEWTTALSLLLFLMGFFFGVIMPAMAAAVTDAVAREGHGRAFGVMSAVYSLGMIFSSFVTGLIREVISPYFIAFLIGMLVLSFVGYLKLRIPRSAHTKVTTLR